MSSFHTLEDLGTVLSTPEEIEAARRTLARHDAMDLAEMLGVAV